VKTINYFGVDLTPEEITKILKEKRITDRKVRRFFIMELNKIEKDKLRR
jgi:hypothetical protein